MALSFSKIDKLLELFSSYEDDQLDELNDGNEERKGDALEYANKSRSIEKTKKIAKSINKETRKKSVKQINEDVKVVQLEVKPIMIKDSDSESERAYVKKQDNIGCSNNNLKLLKDDCIKSTIIESTKKNSKKIKRRSNKRQIVKEYYNSSEKSGEEDSTDYHQNTVFNIKQHTNNYNFKQSNKSDTKTTRTRKNRAQVKRNLRCKDCNRRMKNEQLFMLHTQIHDNRKETECVLCNKDFENINAVLEHYASFDKNKEDEHYVKLRPFPCHLCDLRYKNRKHLTDHLDIHTGHGKYLCPICGKRFFKRFNMSIHLKVHEKSYHSCERCNKNFRNIREYQAHQRNIHGENNITCPVCNRAFSRRNNMKKHMETHERVYNQCDLCNTNFEFRRDFNRHMREVHNRIKKYTCLICGKVFLLHCKLTRHLETHNRIKDNCLLCDKEFRNRRDYNAHVRNLHGVITDSPIKEFQSESSCKMQFKIIHDVQVCQFGSLDSTGIKDNDVKINIKIDINDSNENFDDFCF